MDMSKYMTFDATYEEYDSMDDDTHMSSFKEARSIKVFIYGKDMFIRNEDNGTVVTAETYLTLEAVKPKDKINGQVIKSVNKYPESWNSDNILYEAYTWDT